MITDTLRFDISSQEVVNVRPEKEVEILEIDSSNVQKIMVEDQGQFSSVFGGASATSIWSNCHENLTEKNPVFRQMGQSVIKLSDDGTIKEASFPGDLYYSRIILVPGTKELLIVGGSRDLESESVSNQVI